MTFKTDDTWDALTASERIEKGLSFLDNEITKCRKAPNDDSSASHQSEAAQAFAEGLELGRSILSACFMDDQECINKVIAQREDWLRKQGVHPDQSYEERAIARKTFEAEMGK